MCLLCIVSTSLSLNSIILLQYFGELCEMAAHCTVSTRALLEIHLCSGHVLVGHHGPGIEAAIPDLYLRRATDHAHCTRETVHRLHTATRDKGGRNITMHYYESSNKSNWCVGQFHSYLVTFCVTVAYLVVSIN